jgi:hypothetical protein
MLSHHCTSSSPIARQAIVAALLMMAFVTGAHGAQWSPFWDAVAERADAKVTNSVDQKGEPTRRIDLSSGVSFILKRQGDEITSLELDTSGHGAVRCAWAIYVAVRAHIAACSPGEDPKLEADLDHALDQINDFIVENSLVPITKSELKDALEQRTREAKSLLLGQSPTDQRKGCEAEGISSLARSLKSTPRDVWVSSVTELLSVKRPPV